MRDKRSDILAASVCVAAGIFVSVLPHLIEWWCTGHLAWIADYDDLDVYLLIASNAYHRHPAYLTDPYCPGRGSYLPWLMIIPGVFITHVLNLPATYIGFVWRILAGAGMGVVWFLIFRFYLRNRWLAVSVALFALFDAGTLDGRPLVEHVADLIRLSLTSPGVVLPHPGLPKMGGPWRVMTPGLSWPFLFLYVWLMSRAVKTGSRSSTIWAGLGFGLCFSYFYYWTSAGLGLVLAILLDRKRWRTYFEVGCIGGILGIPSILQGFALKRQGNNDWLPRFDHFLPIGHFNELMFPKIALICLALAFVWLWRSRRDLLFLWCICAAALLLTNQQILTGQQMENWHWHYVWGPTLWLLIVLLVIGGLQANAERLPRMRAVGLAILVFTIATGLWMRSLEVTRAEESLTINRVMNEFVSEFDQNRNVRTDEVVAGTKELVSLLSIVNGDRPLWGYSVRLASCIDNKEWNQRAAVDGYFRGMDREAFVREQTEVLGAERWGAWARAPALRASMLNERVADFDEVAKDPDAAAERFGLKYVVMPAGAKNPNLDKHWSVIVSGPSWQAWERNDSNS